MTLRILLVEDNAADAELIKAELNRAGLPCDLERVESEAGLRHGLHDAPDLVLTDHALPQFGAWRVLEVVAEEAPGLPVLAVTGSLDEETAAEYIKSGASDYVVKDRLHRLGPAARRALEQQATRRRLADAERAAKSLEARYLQAQKMEAVGRLAAGVVREIRDAVQHGAAVTRQLLAFSRQQVLSPRLLDLNELVAGMEVMARRLLRDDIALRLSLARPLGEVHADPGQIEQVLLNLLVNARDAMPRGGRVTIETANADLDDAGIHPTGGRLGAWVVLSVGDTGVGMDADVKARLFEPFFTTKETGKGTGLGLATVYGIVTQTGGRIDVESEPGQGSTFRVALPRAEEPGAVAAVPSEEAVVAAGNETILLVEDEDSVRGVTRRALERQGYTMLEAESAARALEVAAAHHGAIDLLVTDVIMPGGSGTELAKRIRELRPGIAVAFTSGYSDEEVRADVLEFGAPFLQKPFDLASLGRIVRQALDRRPAP